MENVEPRTYQLPTSLLKKLGRVAEDLGISRQEIVKRALEAYLEAIEKQKYE